MKARTRIAPSPTGFVHIGNLRTALFNYFLAKQTGGDFIIRIEDTDQDRLVEGAVEGLLSAFSKLGVPNDEGPYLMDGVIVERGDVGPYVQSKRLDLYKNYVQQLIDQGDAYYCFCTKERLDEMREAQRTTKQTPKYDRTCASLNDEEIEEKLLARTPHVVRMRVPEGETTFEDVVFGTVSFKNSDVDDQVILKSDGFPTYHLAVVVDDHLMNITHILRGQEWIPSTPKHVILYRMFGWDIPAFAHLPLLLNPDKTKLSKRQGDVFVEEYLNRGYLPDALINFVGTLGFNPKSDQEIYSVEELIQLFDLSKVNRAGAVLNMSKLDWMNNHYMKTMNERAFLEAARAFIQGDVEHEVTRKALLVERERADRLDQMQERITPYITGPSYDPSILVWKKSDTADAKKQLENLIDLLSGAGEEIFESIEQIDGFLRAYINENGLQNGNVLWPLRVALSGLERSASPYEFLWVLGKQEALSRLERAIKILV